MTELPEWSVTQNRSQKGSANWCGVVIDGNHPSLDPLRPLAPVLRDTGKEIFWLPEPVMFVTAASSEHGAWWLKKNARLWREALMAHRPVWIRSATPVSEAVPHGSVGVSKGIFETRFVRLAPAAILIVAGKKIAEAR